MPWRLSAPRWPDCAIPVAIGDEAFWTLQRELDHLEATMVEASGAG